MEPVVDLKYKNPPRAWSVICIAMVANFGRLYRMCGFGSVVVTVTVAGLGCTVGGFARLPIMLSGDFIREMADLIMPS